MSEGAPRWLDVSGSGKGGDPKRHAACTDCKHWQRRCLNGRGVTLPDRKIHICGQYIHTEVMKHGETQNNTGNPENNNSQKSCKGEADIPW